MVRTQSSSTLRPYTRADAPQVVEVANAAALPVRNGCGAEINRGGDVHLAGWYVPVSSERIVAVDSDDTIVGFAYFTADSPYVVSSTGGVVHPDVQDQGVDTLLWEWAESRAATFARYAPTGIRTLLEVNVFEVEQVAMRRLLERGYVQMRQWLHLVVELDAPPPPAQLPEHLVLRTMDLEHDWDIVTPAMDDAFSDHWGAITETDLQLPPGPDNSAQPEVMMTEDKSYSNTPGLCFIVLDGDTVAGGILCNGKLVERRDTGRVGSLFVRGRYRRQGIGRNLMLAAFNEFWRRGQRRIITDTDSDSFTQAPQLYTSLGMHVYRRELLFEKEIRPGREVRRMSL